MGNKFSDILKAYEDITVCPIDVIIVIINAIEYGIMK